MRLEKKELPRLVSTIALLLESHQAASICIKYFMKVGGEVRVRVRGET